MPAPLAHPRSDTGDAELARRAATGDGHAFAALYDRHERRVYGFCLRMLGSPHDAADATQETFVRVLVRLPALEGRDLNFVAYALAAARNACYDAIEARGRTRPLADGDGGDAGGGEPMPRDEELTRDPERSALLAAGREEVWAANAQLPPRQREVLILREVEQLSYEQIGELIGLNRNAVAQLISRARIGLRALMRGGAVASIAPSGGDCERALPLLTTVQDDEAATGGELDWLREHLSACETCRASRAAMQEAGTSYRLLAPVVPLVWLRHATIARAAEYVGADWSEVAGQPPPGSPALGSPRAGAGSRARVERADAVAVSAAALATPVGHRRGRRSAFVLAGSLLLLALLLLVLVGVTRDGRVLAPAAARLPTSTTPAGVRVERRARTAGRRGGVHARRVTPPSPPGRTVALAPPKPAATRRVSTIRRHRSKHRAATHHPARPPVAPPPTATTTPATPQPPAQTTPPSTTPTPTTPTTPAPPPPPETPGRGSTEPAPPGFVP